MVVAGGGFVLVLARSRRHFVVALSILSVAVLIALTTGPAGAQRAAQFTPGSCAPLDLAFVVDTTGSMDGAISNVKSGLNRIVDEARTVAGGNLRLEVIEFKDDIRVLTPFASNNEAAAKDAINSLTASGGNREPEASDVALETAVKGLPASSRGPGQQTGDAVPFRPGEKIAVIITDARPGGFDDTYTSADDANATAVARAARDRGIRISAIYVPTFSVETTERNILRRYASISGGQFRQTNSDGSGTATAIDATIATCAGKVSARKRMRLTVNPRARRVGTLTCYTFKATRRSNGRAVRNALVRFAGRSKRTNSQGRATFCVRFNRAGRKGASATRSGYTRATTAVFISRRPTFTG